MADLIAVIAQLKQERQSLSAQLRGLDAALAALTGGAASATRKATPTPARKRKTTMSAAQRKAVSTRMKKYWAARRKAKG